MFLTSHKSYVILIKQKNIIKECVNKKTRFLLIVWLLIGGK